MTVYSKSSIRQTTRKRPSVADPRTLRLPASLSSVARLTEVVREEGEAEGLEPGALIDLELAFVEAANNIVVHGYAGADGEITLEVAKEGGLRVVLIDGGKPIPADLLVNPPAVGTDSERGRGLAIIRACVDHLNYTSGDGLNRLTLFKKRD